MLHQGQSSKLKLTVTSAVNEVLDGNVNSQLGAAAIKLLAFNARTGMLDSSFPLESENLTTMDRLLNRPSQTNWTNVPPLMVPEVGYKLCTPSKNRMLVFGGTYTMLKSVAATSNDTWTV
jgi:hypothetical protein